MASRPWPERPQEGSRLATCSCPISNLPNHGARGAPHRRGQAAAAQTGLKSFRKGDQVAGELRRALDRGDGQGTARIAYGLGSALARLSAGRALDLALRLERLGRENDLQDAADTCAALESALDDLAGILTSLEK